MLDDPKVAEELIYDYRGIKIKEPEMKQVELCLFSWPNYKKNWTYFSHK